MKQSTQLISLVIILVCILGQALKSQNYVGEIMDFRDKLNQQYKSDNSPLKKEDISWFDGHGFFPIDDVYRVEANYSLIEGGEEFEMKTTTDRLPIYKPYAKARFMFKGESHELTLYQNVEYSKRPGYKDYLFLPFKDFTNGDSSYGGGRFIDLRMSKTDKIIIDFNKSYNPLCAYNSKYSCPIPPRENHLQTEINAGVRTPIGFHK